MGQLVSKQTNGSELSKNDIMTIIKSTIPARAVLESFVNSEDIMYGDWVDGYRPITSKRVINGITYYLLKYDQYVRVVRGSDNAAAYYAGEIAAFDPSKWNDRNVFTDATGQYLITQHNYTDYESTDQPGNDLRGSGVTDILGRCKNTCDANPNCVAFNISRALDNQGKGRCHFKSNIAGKSADPNYNLYVKTPYEECVKSNKTRCIVKGL